MNFSSLFATATKIFTNSLVCVYAVKSLVVMTFHYYLIPYFIDAHNEYFACIFIYVKVNYLIDVLCGNLMFMPLNINCPISATNFVCVHPKLYLSLFHHDFYRAGVHDISSDMKIL